MRNKHEQHHRLLRTSSFRRARSTQDEQSGLPNRQKPDKAITMTLETMLRDQLDEKLLVRNCQIDGKSQIVRIAPVRYIDVNV